MPEPLQGKDAARPGRLGRAIAAAAQRGAAAHLFRRGHLAWRSGMHGGRVRSWRSREQYGPGTWQSRRFAS